MVLTFEVGPPTQLPNPDSEALQGHSTVTMLCPQSSTATKVWFVLFCFTKLVLRCEIEDQETPKENYDHRNNPN